MISDGIFGLADAIALGDLPPTGLNRDGAGRLISTTGGVEASSFRADGDLEAGLTPGATGAEGTALLEIIHDIAPGAQLRFANFDTSLEFIAAVDFLAASSDVVVDDIGFYGRPYDQSSDVSANTAIELNRLSNPIRGYYTSVGNQALRHYQEPYVDSGTDGLPLVGNPGNLHRFAATNLTTDCTALGPSDFNFMLLGSGQTGEIWLTWDDAFGSATTDYDLYAVDSDTGVVVAAGVDDNPGVTRELVEAVAFTNSTGASKFYLILIQNFNNASPVHTLEMFAFGGVGRLGVGSRFNFNTLSNSVPAQSDAGGGVVSVGAIDASDPGADDIEPYSSRGPTNNNVTKPDVAAIDGVSISGSGGFPSPFFGTSAAAPHVAGLAALLLDFTPRLLSGEPGDDPGADRTELRAAITSTAVDLGDLGVDNSFGSGRVAGLAAGQALVELASIEVTPALPSVARGLAIQFTAAGTFTDGSIQDVTTEATWTRPSWCGHHRCRGRGHSGRRGYHDYHCNGRRCLRFFDAHRDTR